MGVSSLLVRFSRLFAASADKKVTIGGGCSWNVTTRKNLTEPEMVEFTVLMNDGYSMGFV